jgi:hypothetical protein
MKLYLILVIIIIVLFYIIFKQKRKNQKKTKENNITSNQKNIDSHKINTCVVLFIDLYNEMTERVKSSINSHDRFNINEMILINNDIESKNIENIKRRLRHFHLEGKFNDVIETYLIHESNIDALTYKILELSKTTSKIPQHILIKLEDKDLYIISFLQDEIDKKIKAELFLIDSLNDVELFILELVSASRTKLEFMSLSKLYKSK